MLEQLKKKSQRTTEKVHFQKSDESIRMRKTKTNYSVLAWYVKEMQKVEAMQKLQVESVLEKQNEESEVGNK